MAHMIMYALAMHQQFPTLYDAEIPKDYPK